jgi:hypothetical protein
MALEYQNASPFNTLISFHKLIESLEEVSMSNVDYRSNYAKSLLKEIEDKPEFRNGIEDLSLIKENQDLIKNLLSDLFPTALTHNEIKVATIPFQKFTFNYSERYRKILTDVGYPLEINISDFDEHQFYVLNCCLILNIIFKQKIEFTSPIFFDIPDNKGIIRHYRILYNADFIEILPTEKSIQLKDSEIKLLIDNYDNLDLWKKYFPEKSWILKGFVIATLIDVTTENAISKLKTNLLQTGYKSKEKGGNLEEIFRSIFRVPDLKIGFTFFDIEEKSFVKPPFNDDNFTSFLLQNENQEPCLGILCNYSYESLIEQRKPLIFSNVELFKESTGLSLLAKMLLSQGVNSCVLAPIVKDNNLLGIMEIVSSTAGSLNSINANKLNLILPFISDVIDRSFNDLKNLEEAIIQKEYTAIHSSVYWKFKQEVKKYIDSMNQSKEYIFKEISFKNVFPLYGQIDIKGSSVKRNETVKKDLVEQLQMLITIFEKIKLSSSLLIFGQLEFELKQSLIELNMPLKADTEQQVHRYIVSEINQVLIANEDNISVKELIDRYFQSLDTKTGMFYKHRKDFDHTLTIINKKMALIIDKKQIEAQNIFPHYYERFKTDGVEHNLYIGQSIAPNLTFDNIFISNLRLWQLQTLCEMELEHHRIKDALPYALEVTSLILVFSSPLSIRFRMDEKRFDVDGSYNARYEVIKKRIDKAFVLGTKERITQQEKITIVYSNNLEEKEYLNYIKYLQHINLLEETIEQFEVESLQGVSGLKAIRVKVINTATSDEKYSYQELLEELN